MKNEEKLLKLVNGLAEKKTKEKADKEVILTEYKEKEKVKKLTTDERLTRIEKLLGIS